jgi:hypothetical protein
MVGMVVISGVCCVDVFTPVSMLTSCEGAFYHSRLNPNSCEAVNAHCVDKKLLNY